MKKIENLNDVEIEKILENDDFMRILEDRMKSEIDFSLDDILYFFKDCKRDYSFDYYCTGWNYFKLLNIDNETSLALESFVKNYNLKDDEKKTIENFYKAMDRFLYMNYNNKQYENLENWLENELKTVNSIICDFMDSIIDYYNSKECYKEYIRDCYDNFEQYRYDAKNDVLYKVNENYNKKYLEVRR